jgi:hypothetical protein
VLYWCYYFIPPSPVQTLRFESTQTCADLAEAKHCAVSWMIYKDERRVEVIRGEVKTVKSLTEEDYASLQKILRLAPFPPSCPDAVPDRREIIVVTLADGKTLRSDVSGCVHGTVRYNNPKSIKSKLDQY